ncbi:MAG: phosphate ABC transporter substrate-binding protein [Calothrix sp. C42_A2020_038]|nr:phosphate ABC transporter substrate-binding protein [Calothrix sp. C42_A2020_038]
MSKASNKETLTLILSLLITGGLAAGSLWYFRSNFISNNSIPTIEDNQNRANQNSTTQNIGTSSLDTSLPNPSVLTIDGSVTMVAAIKQLQIAFSLLNPSLPTTYGVPDGKPNGTNAGIRNLIDGKVSMAASSRGLKSDELQAGLVGIPIAKDAIAVTVGINNPYKGGLTMTQLKGIFQGRITNWSEVGGPNLPIRVLNRSRDSGTSTFFQDVVLLGKPFAPDGANFTTFKRDETTPILRALGKDGISYSTVTQIENQKTVRVVPIEGISPTDQTAINNVSYPISRVVYLAVPKQTSPATKQFIDFALSPQGQQVIKRTGFLPIQ